MREIGDLAFTAKAITKQGQEALDFIRKYLLTIDEHSFYQRAETTDNLVDILECSLERIYFYLKDLETINLYTLGSIVAGLRVIYTFSGQVKLTLNLSDPIYVIGKKLESADDGYTDLATGNLVEIYGHAVLGYEKEAKKMISSFNRKKKGLVNFPDLPRLYPTKKDYKNNDWSQLKSILKAHIHKLS